MKKIFLLLFINCIMNLGYAQHQKFSIKSSHNAAGGSTPTLTPITYNEAITESQANDLVKYFLESSKLDFKCVYNGCQNRATVMSLLLKEKNIRHYKIWNFNPFKISLVHEQGPLNVDDILKLKNNRIFWDFHVAVSVLVKNENNSTDTLVIDPSFANKPLKVNDWLALQNSPNSHYTFLDPKWYNFVTIQNNVQFPYKENGAIVNYNYYVYVPNFFPQIITGDYYNYDISKQVLIAKELATNEQITKMADVIYNLPVQDPARTQLVDLVSGKFEDFKNVLEGTNTLAPNHAFEKYLNEYKGSYKKSYDYWLSRLKKLGDYN